MRKLISALFFSIPFIVFAQNNTPIASNVSAATIKNTNASIHLVASDADYDSLTYAIVSDPSNGTATLSGATVTYTPTTDFSGTDTFTFKANDGVVDSATKTVTIKVIGGYKTTQTQIGTDIDGADNDYQGRSVSFNEDHTIMAVGAYNHDSGKGTVRIYTYNGTDWSKQGDDLDGEAGDYQGTSVSLSSNGTTLAVGAFNHDSGKGTIRIYTYDGTNWVRKGDDLDGEAGGDSQGIFVSLSSDGTTLAVGAFNHDSNKGTVRIYTWSEGSWSKQGDLVGAAGDYQGRSVSLSSDGRTLAVGAYKYDSNKGTVRIYTYDGSDWTKQGDDLDGEAGGDKQGISVSLSSDGRTLAVGASGHDSLKGTVRIYTHNGTNWSKQGDDLDGEAGVDKQGASVSLSSDGTALAVGAYKHDSDKGTVRIYTHNGTNWVRKGDDLDGEAGDNQGNSVSLSSDGTTLAVGAFGHDSNKGTVRVYNLVNANAPVASNVSAATIKNSNAIIHLVASDEDYDSLTYAIVSDPSNGTATLSGDTVTYTPTTDFVGTDTFTFKANDGFVDSATKTVTIKVIDGYKTTQTQIGTDIDGADNGYQGRSVSFNEDHTIMAVGAYMHDSLKGTVRIYTYNGTDWSQQGDDLDGEAAYDFQGRSVSLSSDGTTLAVGAYRHDSNKGTVRIYTYDGTNWVRKGDDLDGEAGDYQGISVSLSSNGTTLAVGAYYHDSSKGTVRIFTYNGTAWSQQGPDLDGETGDYQGFSVSLSSDGTTLAVGADGHDSNKGTVRIYTYNGTDWVPKGADLDGAEGGDRQGNSVSLSSDGTTLAVGAYYHDSNKGTVRIYTYNGTDWSKQGDDLDGAAANDYQGASVSLSSDGTTLAVGAYKHDSNKGTVRIYTYDGSEWSKQGDDLDGEAGDYQGNSVSLSSDGTTLAVGAFYHDGGKGTVRVYNLVNANAPVASNVSAATIKNTNAIIHLVASDAGYDSLTYAIVSDPSNGSATLSGATVTYTPTTDFVGTDTFTFKANDGFFDSATKTVTIKVIGGYKTTQTQIGTDIDGADNDYQGDSVSFNEDHTIMAVGAYMHDSDKGTVRIYTYNGTDWSKQGDDLDGEAGDRQGYSVSLSSDGTTLAVGAVYHDSNKGTVRIYTYDGTDWSKQGDDLDGEAGDRQGYSVSLSSDGTTLAVGAVYHDSNKGTVRIYTYDGTNWVRKGDDLDGEADDYQGVFVSLSSDGRTLAVGAYKHDSNKGTVRIYTYDGSDWSKQGDDLDGEADDFQGRSVSLSSDGRTLAVGASGQYSGKGTVRIYTYDGSDWTKQGADLDGAEGGDRQGYSVSLSSDGTTLAVGAYGHDGFKGTVRIYTYDGTNWVRKGDDLDGEAGDNQGISVSLSSDGTTLAVGAHRHDSNNGTVRVYNLVNANAPVAVADSSTVLEDAALSSIDVIANDTDADGDALIVTAVSTSGSGTVAINADGVSVNYTPALDFNGTETITYTVSDGTLTDATGTLTITVTAENDAPVAVDDTVSLEQGNSTIVTLSATDADDDALTYSIVEQPANGTVTLAGNQATYTSTDITYTGADSFTFTASDGNLTSNTATITIDVTLDVLSYSLENIKTYPNPFNEFYIIESIVPLKIEVYDINGRVVLKKQLVPGTNKINSSKLSKGYYLFKFIDKHRSSSKILIKQ